MYGVDMVLMVVFISALLATVPKCNSQDLGSDIAEKLATFANDGLGIQAFQDYLDNEVTFVDEVIDATATVKQIAESMSDKIQVRIDALTEMKDEIADIYTNNGLVGSNPFPDCCTVALQEKNLLLNTEVNYDELCTVGQGVSSASEFLPVSVTNVISTQYQKALGIKYAYFGSEEGVMFNYPAVRACDETYDPRFRPWYVETASAEPKDVVIILDKSGSMGDRHGSDTLMDIAKSAGITVLETLNPNDRVGVVAFSDEAETPAGSASTSTCYRNNLAKATAENKDYLKTYISALQPGGATYYNKALDKAFDYFDAAAELDSDSMSSEERDKVILFLTDGSPTETDHDDIYNKIALRNSDVKNEVVILTYGLGSLGGDADTILENMAKQIKAQIAYGEITEGVYTRVTDPSNLRSAMASYYDEFLSESQDIVFSVPYLDAFGSGLLISLCLPVTDSSNAFKGVACMDLAIDDLLSDITYFREGETSYAFIIDEYGRVLTHPLLPNPSEITNNPLFIYITALETVSDIDSIRESMVKGEVGESTGSTRIVSARGDVQLEGVIASTQLSTYSWHPIDGSSFSICLVVGVGDERTSVQWTSAYPDYVYHRLDLITGHSTCRTFDRVAVTDRSTVMLAARAFQDPFNFLYTVETINDINGYETYLKGTSSYNPWFKEGVRETVAATAKFEELMNDPANDYEMYSVWRYISTDDGVHRIYPGVQIPKNYDPTQRAWYMRAKTDKGRITVSTPYEDAFGAGNVVTLSRAIYEGNPTRQHALDDRTIAVMGVDFTLQYFYNLVTSSVSACDTNTCLVIDSAGFIVAHKDWITPSQSTPETTNVHVARKNPLLATKLKTEGLMKYSACVNVEELRDQYSWTVKIPDVNNGVFTDSYFDLHEIEDTNIFLVVLKSFFSASCFSCGNDVYLPCVSTFSSVGCFCPCYSTADIYKYCLGEFEFTSDENPPCTPPVPEVSFDDVNAQDAGRVGSLQECYDYNCGEEAKNSNNECNSVIRCSWCEYDGTGAALAEAYCDTSDTCPGGYLSTGGDPGDGPSGGDDVTPSDGDGGGGSLWWISIVVLAVLFIAAIFIGLYCNHKEPCKKASSETDGRPPPSVSAVSGGRMQGVDNLAMDYRDSNAHKYTPDTTTPTGYPSAPTYPNGNNAGNNINSSYMTTNNLNRPPMVLPPINAAPAHSPSSQFGYTNPVAYNDKSAEGGGYEVPNNQYSSLDYSQMNPQSGPYDTPPPAYGSADKRY